MPGESRPEQETVPPVTFTVPLPRSVARGAQLAPDVVMFTSASVSRPPLVAITPCPPSPVALIVTFVRLIAAPDPVGKAPLAPVPLVVIEPPTIVTVLFAVASTAALRP